MSIYINIVTNKCPISWLYSVNNIDFNNYARDIGINPNINNNYAIEHATHLGYFNQVKLLLKDKRVTDTCCFERFVSNILVSACTYKNTDFVRELLDDYIFSYCTLVGALEESRRQKCYEIEYLLLNRRELTDYDSSVCHCACKIVSSCTLNVEVDSDIELSSDCELG